MVPGDVHLRGVILHVALQLNACCCALNHQLCCTRSCGGVRGGGVRSTFGIRIIPIIFEICCRITMTGNRKFLSFSKGLQPSTQPKCGCSFRMVMVMVMVFPVWGKQNEAECFCSASSKIPQDSKCYFILSLNSRKGYFPNLACVCPPSGHLVSHDHRLITALCSATAALQRVRDGGGMLLRLSLPLWQRRGILKRFHLMMA